ncbi:hypothetical protein GCM10010156_37120 [Planobispora rosea]|uniref:Type IV pilus assembly protein PilA n=1 Tax=Planobispora rosea TaxID=35762 RepID=A0A8J3RTZ4_PLARO|nr:prepilin-type N-terminal cleavage/methylation domain-containing protein [Planobispora rosea]GGS74891.1 hypothetical protein GCM10010156_37120 [Planobispora rosea]GIH81787.1 hypothetical protein Pro02_01950 [Planobispora rosea]
MKAALDRLQKRAHGDRGFTLIELLVVVVIIGVLVAIAIPVYMNYREGAADKAAQSDVRSAITAVESYYTMNGNKYPAALPTDAKKSEGTTLTYVQEGTGYLICANNLGGSGDVYMYDSSKGGAVANVKKTIKVATCKA